MGELSFEDLEPYAGRLREWLTRYHYSHFVDRATALPLRRDTLTLLAYARDNRVVGTKSTGNMPLKHIRQVTQTFVDPPEVDDHIGDRIYRLRTEYDLWPLYFIHTIAQAAGLLVTLPGRRWRLTSAGEQFMKGDPLLQTLSLLSSWWYRVDWVIAYWVGGLAAGMPAGFQAATLTLLLDHAVGRRIEFEAFSDTLIARTGLTWSSPDMSGARDSLHFAVRRMVITPLHSFGIIETETRPSKYAPLSSPELLAFRLLWFGRALLEGLAL